MSSFTTEGKLHPGYHQVFLHNRRETTQREWNKIKPVDQAFNKPKSELSTLSELHKLSQGFHYSVESKERKQKWNEVLGSGILFEDLKA
ncbi:hypothetical protein Taro_011353 [Colocasia esculenta]|uniref:Uncharacterized protein n=1 Tax=Colocasia esculenta TaxID=4460 RepID=A0A843U5K6_COLES|nr:hypothetical protein [Colocasia esculenta]